MIIFLTLIVSAYSFDKGALKSGLQSASGQLRLYHQWQKQEHKTFSPDEDKKRFRVFKQHLKEIVEINDSQDMFVTDANFMAGLTEEEQKQYYGLNITDVPPEALEDNFPPQLSSAPTSGSKDWRKEGKITPVKNQGGCGSCWAFAGIAAFEGHYAARTGALKRFSEQEFVDCSYRGHEHGCKGGWYWWSFDYVKSKQRLAMEKDYPYTQRAGRCRQATNGMTAASCDGNINVRSDSQLVQALGLGPVSVAYSVNGGLNYYRSGVLSLRNCPVKSEHAMAATGYTPSYFEIKNSWGSHWGDRGYFRADRRYNNMCGISSWASYPSLRKTGSDSSEDMDNIDDGDGSCSDGSGDCEYWAGIDECYNNYDYMLVNCKKSCKVCGCRDGHASCAAWKSKGYCESGSEHERFASLMCKKTCGKCTDDGKEEKEEGDSRCPPGLTFCHGECKHEHFCHM